LSGAVKEIMAKAATNKKSFFITIVLIYNVCKRLLHHFLCCGTGDLKVGW
jgi:hypothetical protein